MDLLIHNIGTSKCLFFTPHGHTEHKTQRAPRQKGGDASGQESKPPQARCHALCGLLNDSLMAVDFTNYREVGRHLAFIGKRIAYRTLIRCVDGFPALLSAWQCYIARYP